MANQSNNKHAKEVRETEAWFKDLVEQAHDLVQCVDSEGRFIYVNQAWLATLKYSPAEVENITLFDVIHPDSMEHCMAAFEQVLKGQAFGEIEAVFVTKEGTPVAVEGSVNVKIDKKDGRFVHTRGIFRDVTGRKKAEEALKKREAEYHRLYSMLRIMSDTMPDMLWAKDLDRKYIFANKAICKTFSMQKIPVNRSAKMTSTLPTGSVKPTPKNRTGIPLANFAWIRIQLP